MDPKIQNALIKFRSTSAATAFAKIFKFSSGYTDQAYHGTSSEIAGKILSAGFEVAQHENNWLGTGVYFFEGSFSEAESWAKINRAFTNPAVLCCIVEFGTCLRLMERVHCEAVRKFKNAMQTAYGIVLTETAAIGALSAILDLDTIKAVQTKGGHGSPVGSFRGSWSAELPVQILLCVRKLERIKRCVIVDGPQ